ncbi:TRAP transporter permease [Thalassospira indica]|uniref:TRAP transporter permease n=1 Tax=Thalassospira indica TaxID=1891279 RepID=A0ABN5NHT1_9PROT|nr:TRAP transporter fused permease subunit [Thalassospira indica]AXO15760.1 TRAP transporter permease [Thalassospira indica]
MRTVLFSALAWRVLAAIAIALHITFIVFIPISDTILNAWHLSFVLCLGFGAFSLLKDATLLKRLRDTVLALTGLCAGVYFILNEDQVFERFELTLMDQLVAFGAVLLVLELTRRVVGWVIPAIAVFLMAYVMYLGKYADGVFFFGGISEYRMAYRLFWQDGALLGSTTTISATIIFMFVFMSCLMRAAGATQFIINGTASLLRKIPGGSAHVAVLSSALMGTVSGSAVANVAGTGALTIPMMKRAGLKPEIAGGVEAAASTGSQLVPPIMGAGIFIMSDWVGVPYTELVLLGIIPAILYFMSISFTVHLQLLKSGKLNICEDDEVPEVRLRDGVAFIVPIAVLIILLSIGYSPVYSAAIAAAGVVVCSFLGPQPLTVSKWIPIVEDTMKTVLPTAIVLICSGLIVVSVETSGLVVALAQSLAAFGNENALIILGLIALISMFLGMGLPVTASYIVVAAFGAQALVSLGVEPVAAHMAIFWLSQDSLLTPPVCLAAFAAAGIAGGNPVKTGVNAMMLGKGLYIMPVLFVFHGLLFTNNVSDVVHATGTGVFALALLAVASTGQAFAKLNAYERLITASASILILFPSWSLQVAGAAIGGAILLYSFVKRNEKCSEDAMSVAGDKK